MQRFILVSQPRSGTHMLKTMLAQHPKIEIGKFHQGEVFNTAYYPKYPSQDPRWVLENRGWLPGEVSGFVLHLTQLKVTGDFNLLELLQQTPNIRYICITRANHLDRYTSARQAIRHKKWQVKANQDIPALDKIRIDRELFKKNILEYERNWEYFYSVVNPNDIQVTYEELQDESKRKTVMAKIFKFLGLDNIDIDTSIVTKKVSTVPTRSQILNYEEIVDLNTLYKKKI